MHVVFASAVWFTLIFALSLGLGEWAFQWLSARRVMDVPNARSSHERPTARGGGLAIQAALAAGVGILALSRQPQGLMILPPIVVLTIIGFWDDLREVPAAARLGAHLVATVMALALLGWPRLVLEWPAVFEATMPSGIGAALWIFWVAGMINAFNFMDGTNGHAAFQAIITGVAGAAMIALGGKGGWLLPALYLTVAGAAAGFLPHNFPRARMFMGDAGSVPLGAALGILAMWSARDAGPGVLAPLAMLQFNFILDTAVTLARRLWRGKKPLEAHREHLYERFAVAAGSHSRAVAVENAVLLLAAGLLISYPLVGGAMKGLILAAVVAVWTIYYASVERFCRLRGCGTEASATIKWHTCATPLSR